MATHESVWFQWFERGTAAANLHCCHFVISESARPVVYQLSTIVIPLRDIMSCRLQGAKEKYLSREKKKKEHCFRIENIAGEPDKFFRATPSLYGRSHETACIP